MDQLLLPCEEALEPLDESSVRADYEALLDRCARLMAYAQSSPQYVLLSVVERQDRLAEDDLITFALRARRFIHSTSLVPLAKNVFVPRGPLKAIKSNDVWCILNTIPHYIDLIVMRNEWYVRTVYRGLKGTLKAKDLVWDEASIRLRPLVFVRSPQRMLSFDLLVFLDLFLRRILHPAQNSCHDRGVDLKDAKRMLEEVKRLFD